MGELRFLAGAGVGTVTEPGIRVPVGEPAINPMPRQMMRWAAERSWPARRIPGFDLEIGCEDGATIARKTFNPRLGILGGISILGTTGMVEPMSLAAYMASIEVYIRVALGGGAESAAYAPGKIGTSYATSDACSCRRSGWCRSPTSLALRSIARICVLAEDRSPVAGAVDGRPSGEAGQDVRRYLGHPFRQEPDGHGRGGAGRRGVWVFAGRTSALGELQHCGSGGRDAARAPARDELWCAVEKRIAAAVHARLKQVDRVEARLFGLHGVALGQAA